MAKPANEMTMRRFYVDVLGKGKIDLIDDLMDRKFIEHETPPPGFKSGIEGVKQLFTAMRAGFPDLKVQVHDMFSHEDRVVSRVTFTGTHKGSFLNVPATGNRVAFEAIDIVRFSKGKAVEHWGVSDNLGMLQQLGVISREP